MKVKINTHGNALPEVHGEWIDLCTAEDVTLDFLEYKIISLGVSIEIPAGYYAHVVPRSSERVLNAAAKGLLFLFLYVMLDLCWIGAECVFEGIVHESRVDGVVLAWLCLLLVREIEQFERKIRGDGR